MTVEFGQQLRNIGGVILPIGINGNDDTSGSIAEAYAEGRALPCIRNKRQNAQFRNGGCE